MAFHAQNAKLNCLMSVFLIKDNPTVFTLWASLNLKYFSLQRLLNVETRGTTSGNCSKFKFLPIVNFWHPFTWIDSCRIRLWPRHCRDGKITCFLEGAFLARSCNVAPSQIRSEIGNSRSCPIAKVKRWKSPVLQTCSCHANSNANMGLTVKGIVHLKHPFA